MSGIGGIFFRDGRPANVDSLKKMATSMAHRGPHGEGVWARGPAGFVHRLLATCPEGVERQPLADRNGELCITFDGRVDNREELFTALEIAQGAWEAMSDAVLVLAAYRQWGEECAGKILGDFAFAIGDQAQRKIFCVRDAMGIKPFFYFLDDQKFVFASEMQAIFASGEVERRADLTAVARYLTGDFANPEQTLYQGVGRLPARYALTVNKERVDKRAYWDLDPTRTVRYANDAEYAEHFREILSAAVRSRLRSRTPIGARVSGGLDSSSVACVAQGELTADPNLAPSMEIFSNTFEGLRCDERPFIEDVVAKTGAKANFFPFLADAHNEPRCEAEKYPDTFYHPGMLVNVPMCSEMRERGFHVAFEGIGGDELLAPGCEHVTDLIDQRNLSEAWREMRRISDACGFGFSALLYSYGVIPFVPRFLKRVLRPLRQILQARDVERCVRVEYRRRAGKPRGTSSRREAKYGTRAQQRIYDVLYAGWNALIAVEGIEAFSARFGIEVRYPFLDRRVAEFVIGLPAEQRWRGQSKFILREAMHGILPESVRTRRGKADFSSLLESELTGKYAGKIRHAFANSSLAAAGILDREKLLGLFDMYQAKRDSRFANDILFLAGMEFWFQQANDWRVSRETREAAGPIPIQSQGEVIADG